MEFKWEVSWLLFYKQNVTNIDALDTKMSDTAHEKICHHCIWITVKENWGKYSSWIFEGFGAKDEMFPYI